MLVFYDEGRGLRQPEVKLFNPSASIEGDVNEWIGRQGGTTVHRIDWLPSGGLMGAAVYHSEGHRAAESLRVPMAGDTGKAAVPGDVGLQRFGVGMMLFGIAVGVVALVLFTVFFPATWYGGPDALMDRDLAVKLTVLVAGLGILMTTLGLAFVFRGRLAPE
jgi:hypothetical protein